MIYRVLLAVMVVIALAGCGEKPPAGCEGAACLDASSPADGGGGGSPCGTCPASTPVCDADGGTPTCVECASAGDCGGDTPLCSAARTCVQCLADADCTDPQAAHCQDGACVPCSDSSQCEGTGVAKLCDASRTPATCVQCTLADSSACSPATQTCDLVSGSCAGVAPHSLGQCEACTNDLQCGTSARCVPMQYQGAPHGSGGYCLRIPSPDCPTQQYSTPVTADSLNGQHGTYCGVMQTLTTCEAVRALENDVTCSLDSDCPDGGLCRNVGLMHGLYCSYRCTAPSQCFDAVLQANKATCSDGPLMDGVNYCGG